ncbi:MAG: TULIP family P47-like protein, partial [Rhodobacteraceae bacterium]|nr:TULIP family P47-like protein [Paracoccaceae bacterium]
PEIDPLVQTGTNPITWPTQQSKFTITAVQLNESVQLSGDPGFA